MTPSAKLATSKAASPTPQLRTPARAILFNASFSISSTETLSTDGFLVKSLYFRKELYCEFYAAKPHKAGNTISSFW
jgi:hypothetical protein